MCVVSWQVILSVKDSFENFWLSFLHFNSEEFDCHSLSGVMTQVIAPSLPSGEGDHAPLRSWQPSRGPEVVRAPQAAAAEWQERIRRFKSIFGRIRSPRSHARLRHLPRPSKGTATYNPNPCEGSAYPRMACGVLTAPRRGQWSKLKRETALIGRRPLPTG